MSPESYVGSIGTFTGTFAPHYWTDCDGKTLPIRGYEALFSIVGTLYGGNGRDNFAVPDLRPKDQNGARVDWYQMGMPRQCICYAGVYPPRD